MSTTPTDWVAVAWVAVEAEPDPEPEPVEPPKPLPEPPENGLVQPNWPPLPVPPLPVLPEPPVAPVPFCAFGRGHGGLARGVGVGPLHPDGDGADDQRDRGTSGDGADEDLALAGLDVATGVRTGARCGRGPVVRVRRTALAVLAGAGLVPVLAGVLTAVLTLVGVVRRHRAVARGRLLGVGPRRAGVGATGYCSVGCRHPGLAAGVLPALAGTAAVGYCRRPAYCGAPVRGRVITGLGVLRRRIQGRRSRG